MKRLSLLFSILLFVVLPTTIYAQSRIVNGRVLDEIGRGYPGAGVTVKGTSTGTVTDVNGNFQLSVPDGATLVIQAIGYNKQEIVPAGTSVTIKLVQQTQQLQGTVVTALAIRREKRDLGYSATTLTNDELTGGNNTSALTAIQGKTAGVNITSSTGGPGGSTRVVLRGEKTINGSNNALIVVDGIPINNKDRTIGRDERYQIDFGNQGNDVNPDDIESITVLKGPAAAALYGSDGANGAIMITTKSGKGRQEAKKNSLMFQTSYTLSDVLKLPELQNKYGQGDTHNVPDDRRENFSWGLPFDGQLRPWGQEIDGQQKVKPYAAQPDNVRSFFNMGMNWQNSLSMGGNTDRGSYYISLNTLNSTGVIPNTFYNKYSLRFNGSLDLPHNMYSSINVNYINSYSRVEVSGQGDESVYNNVLQQPRDIPIHELKDLNNKFNAMIIKDSNGVDHYGYYGAYSNNPYWVAENVDNRDMTDRVLGSMNVGIKPDDHWNIYNRVGIDFVSDRSYSKTPKYDVEPFDAFYTSAGGPQKHVANGGYYQGTTNSFIIYNDLVANYTKPLSEHITFDGLIGTNLTYSRSNLLSGNIDNQTNGLVVPGYYNLQNAQGPVDNVNELTESSKTGIYGDVKLNYKRTFFLEMTGRNDWTSTLVPGNRSFFYPSVNASWVFTESMSGGFKDKVLNYGKLRGGYASVGNGALAYQNNGPAFVRTVSETGFGSIRFPFNGIPGYSYTNILADPNLRPERTNSWEIGTELAFLQSRITFEATYYNNMSIDLIQEVPTAPSSGFTAYVLNVGDISNKGIELQVKVTPVRTVSGFQWDVYATYTKNTNNVERLANGATQTSLGGLSGMTINATVGKPFGSFYATDLATDKQGHVIVDSATGMPQLTASPVYKGTYQPDYTASLGTTLKYKGLVLNILFDTKQGGVFYSRTKDIMDFTGTSKETENRDPQVFPNSVYLASDGTYKTNSSKYDPYDYYTSVIPSGQNIVSATYVKLREISLYYNFPDRWLKRTMFGSASVGIYGNNLFIWTAADNKYADPEMNSGGSSNLQGFEFSSRPSVKNFGASLKFTF